MIAYETQFNNEEHLILYAKAQGELSNNQDCWGRFERFIEECLDFKLIDKCGSDRILNAYFEETNGDAEGK